jgi:hypothetical protein
MSSVLLIACLILMGRLFLLRDRKWKSSSNLVWLASMFLWWTEGKGCPSDLVLKYGGPIAFDSRSGVSSWIQVWFWAFMVFFRWTEGCAVVEAE